MLKKWNTINYFYKYLDRCIKRKKDFTFSKEDLNFYYKKYDKLQKYLHTRYYRNIDLKRIDILSKILSQYTDDDFKVLLKELKDKYELSIISHENDSDRLSKIQCNNFDRMLDDNVYYKMLSDKLIEIILFLRNNGDLHLNIKKKNIKNDDMSIRDICITLLGAGYMDKYY